MSYNDGLKSVTERYCPVVKHNVPVEVTHCSGKETGSRCLNSIECKKELGECKNGFMNGAYSEKSE